MFYFLIFTSGDIILELNGRHIRNLDTANKTLDSRYGKVTVALVPVETKNQNRIQEKLASQGSRLRRARNLFAKVEFYQRKLSHKKLHIDFQILLSYFTGVCVSARRTPKLILYCEGKWEVDHVHIITKLNMFPVPG